ncbi:MAG: terminase small subunit [Dehalococcoidia bacterium]|nr:terminase small subunit [Dehalococcoidia bacterium]
MKKLGPKQARFVEEYLVDLNATQAAIRTGYSQKTAEVQGCRLLRNVKVVEAIAAAQTKRSERLEITLDKWLRELAIIGFSDIENYINIDDYGCIVAKTFEQMPKDSSRALEVCEEVRTIKEDPGTKDKKGEATILNSRIRFKLHDKLGALEKIGKSLGFLKDKIDHSGEVAHTVQFIMPRPREKADKK